MRKLLRTVIAVGAVLGLGLGTASAQRTRTIGLTRTDNKTTVATELVSVGVSDVLNVSCDKLDCREIRAKVDTGPVLSPGDDSTKPLEQRTFTLPGPVKPGSKVQLRACALSASDSSCTNEPVVAEVRIGEGPPGAGPAPSRSDVLQFCSAVGAAQSREIYSVRGREDFTVIVFDESGPCFISRQFGPEGDPIAIGFVSLPGPTVSLDLDPCSTLAAAPKVLISADVSSIQIQSRTDGGLAAEWFPPLRRCFGTATGIKLAIKKDGEAQAKAAAYTLKQFERYRATVQIGVAASELHQQTFGLRVDGAAKRIIETTADERGPEYVGAVVIYALPRYFFRRSTQTPCYYETPARRVCQKESLPPSRENFFGRDPVNENGVLDRVGLLFGVGLNQPGRRFLIGGAFELVTGVNLFLTREFVRLPELEGAAVGDVFAGEAATIPTRDHWRQAWTAGVALDARYAVGLFQRK
jgi:hypothetical protein